MWVDDTQHNKWHNSLNFDLQLPTFLWNHKWDKNIHINDHKVPTKYTNWTDYDSSSEKKLKAAREIFYVTVVSWVSWFILKIVFT